PPRVLIRCTVLTPESVPLPRCAVTSSLSHGISPAVCPATLATALPTTALPSTCSQLGPAKWRPTLLPSSSKVAIGSRKAHASLPSVPALHSETCAPSAWSVTTALSPGAAIAAGTCADAALVNNEPTMPRNKLAVRMRCLLSPVLACRHSRHRLLEVLVHLVEKAGGREPFLIGADEQREVLGHEAGLDRADGDLLQDRGEFRERGVIIELGAMREPPCPGEDRCDRIGRGLLALLVLAVVARHRAVCRLRFDHLAVRRHEHRRHQPERAVALRHGVR